MLKGGRGVGLVRREKEVLKKMFGSNGCDTIFASRLRKTGKFLKK